MLLKEAKEILKNSGFTLNESVDKMNKAEKYVLLYCILKFGGGEINVLSTLKDAMDMSVSFQDKEDEIIYYIGEGYFGGPGNDVDENDVIVASYYDENDGEEPDDESIRDFDKLIVNYARRTFSMK